MRNSLGDGEIFARQTGAFVGTLFGRLKRGKRTIIASKNPKFSEQSRLFLEAPVVHIYILE
jgi:hypothetical protein